MSSFSEPPFKINGVKSWIHCIDCRAEEISEQMKGRVADRYHYHEYIEFLYSLDTDMNVWINGVPHRVLTGDLIVINSGELHSITFNKDSHYICVKFSPRILYFDDNSLFEFKHLKNFLSDSSQQRVFNKEHLSDVSVHDLATGIMEEWNAARPAYFLDIRADILKIFAAIFRYLEYSGQAQTEASLTEPIKKALLYISENFESVTERDAAESCGLSYNHFSTSFKKAVGLSFVEYVTILRLNEAEKLLLSSGKSITDIAYSCGFSSTSHFIAKYKAYKKITPGQVRKRIAQ